VVGGRDLPDDDMEAVATLGPHREGVWGPEGAKIRIEMGAEGNGCAHGCFI
jgi:hypothetical protein